MSEDQLRRTVLESLSGVAPEVDPEKLDPKTSFHDQYDIDSLDFLNFVLELERRVGIHVPEGDYPKLSSLDAAVGYLERLQTASGAEP